MLLRSSLVGWFLAAILVDHKSVKNGVIVLLFAFLPLLVQQILFSPHKGKVGAIRAHWPHWLCLTKFEIVGIGTILLADPQKGKFEEIFEVLCKLVFFFGGPWKIIHRIFSTKVLFLSPSVPTYVKNSCSCWVSFLDLSRSSVEIEN